LQNFSDVLPDEVQGLPTKGDIDFSIDIFLGATPMSNTPYIVKTLELLEMKIQLQEVLEKRYIHPSVSPWGTIMLFVKNKDGNLRFFCNIPNHPRLGHVTNLNFCSFDQS